MVQIGIFVPKHLTEECPLLKIPTTGVQIYVYLTLLSEGTNETIAKV